MKLLKINKDDSKYLWTKCSECEGIDKGEFFEIHTKTLKPAVILCKDCVKELSFMIKSESSDDIEFYI